MFKKSICTIYVLITNILFAAKEIVLPASPEIAFMPEPSSLPKGFSALRSIPENYDYIEEKSKKFIAEKIFSDIYRQSKIYEYIKINKILSNDKYLIFAIKYPGQNNESYYSFIWKKKKYSETTDIEKEIANYYKINKKTELEFLYYYPLPYFQNSLEPWAVRFNNQMHATIWVKAIKRSFLGPSSVEPIFYLSDDDENSKVSLLIDENNQILARRVVSVNDVKQIKFKK